MIHMAHQLEIQKYHYFEEGNTYTGQKTKEDGNKLLRYLVEPFQEDGLLKAYSWTQDVCFDRAQEKEEKEFPLTEEGLAEAVQWLEARFDQL